MCYRRRPPLGKPQRRFRGVTYLDAQGTSYDFLYSMAPLKTSLDQIQAVGRFAIGPPKQVILDRHAKQTRDLQDAELLFDTVQGISKARDCLSVHFSINKGFPNKLENRATSLSHTLWVWPKNHRDTTAK